jgi:hypothetical protein
MAKYLISFPSAAMNVPDSEREAVGRDAHAVIHEAKAAGSTSSAAASTKMCRRCSSRPMVQSPRVATRGRPRSTVALPCSNCPRTRRPSRGPRALRKPAGASKSYASSGSTRGPEGGIEMAQKVQPNNSFKPRPHCGAA